MIDKFPHFMSLLKDKPAPVHNAEAKNPDTSRARLLTPARSNGGQATATIQHNRNLKDHYKQI